MFLLVCSIVLAGLALTAALLLPGNQPVYTKRVSAGSSAITSSAPVKNTAGYLLREYKGKIGVFAAGSSSPQQVLDVYINSLPKDDQEKLKKGISAKNHDQLLGLIENYAS